MRKIILLLLLFTSCTASKLNLEKEYSRAIEQLNPMFEQDILMQEQLFLDQRNGAAIFLTSKIIRLDSLSDSTKRSTSKRERSEQDVWTTAGIFYNDTLTIHLGQIFGNEFIYLKIAHGKTEATFMEYYKYDKFLKQVASAEPTNKLNVPLSSADIQLSKSKDFKDGDIIYGKANILTSPYYRASMQLGFEKVQRSYEVNFKFGVKTFPKE